MSSDVSQRKWNAARKGSWATTYFKNAVERTLIRDAAIESGAPSLSHWLRALARRWYNRDACLDPMICCAHRPWTHEDFEV